MAGGCSSGGETLEALFLCDLQCALKARQDRNSVHCVRCCVNRCVTVQNIAGSPNGNWKGRESGYNVKRELGRGPTKAQEMARIRQIFSYFSPVSFRGPIMHRASPRVVKVYFSSTLCFVPLLVPLSVFTRRVVSVCTKFDVSLGRPQVRAAHSKGAWLWRGQG